MGEHKRENDGNCPDVQRPNDDHLSLACEGRGSSPRRWHTFFWAGPTYSGLLLMVSLPFISAVALLAASVSMLAPLLALRCHLPNLTFFTDPASVTSQPPVPWAQNVHFCSTTVRVAGHRPPSPGQKVLIEHIAVNSSPLDRMGLGARAPGLGRVPDPEPETVAVQMEMEEGNGGVDGREFFFMPI